LCFVFLTAANSDKFYNFEEIFKLPKTQFNPPSCVFHTFINLFSEISVPILLIHEVQIFLENFKLLGDDAKSMLAPRVEGVEGFVELLLCQASIRVSGSFDNVEVILIPSPHLLISDAFLSMVSLPLPCIGGKFK
jgi:hypothetical protein